MSLSLTGQPWEPVYRELLRFFPHWPMTSEAVTLPSVQSLNQGFVQFNRHGRRLRFVAQDSALPFPHLDYESRIFIRGLIATRANWHDTFNALVWRAFPRTKAALNATHWQAMQDQDGSLRAPRRDALTLFDECGVVVLARERDSLQELAAHRWRRFFVGRSGQWRDGRLQVMTFGHAMYEKYLRPYVGMTAKALLVHVPHEMPTRKRLDAALARGILDGVLLKSTVELAPLPVLGIPGWLERVPGDFFDNARYFRPPGPRATRRTIAVLADNGVRLSTGVI